VWSKMTLHFGPNSPKLYITDYIQFAKELCKNKFLKSGIAGNIVVGFGFFEEQKIYSALSLERMRQRKCLLRIKKKLVQFYMLNDIKHQLHFFRVNYSRKYLVS